MCDDKNMKEQTWIIFNVGLIMGIFGGVLGNLLVTSGFATAHYYNLNFNLFNLPAVAFIFIVCIVLLLIIAGIVVYNLKDYFR